MRKYIFLILSILIFAVLQSGDLNKKTVAIESKIMDSDQTFEIIVSIPWGDKVQQLKPQLLNYPNFGEMLPEQQRKIYAPLHIKLDSEEGIHVLNDENRDIQDGENIFITHFTPSGNLNGKTPIPKNQPRMENRIIIDFVVDRELNSYLLEKFNLDNVEYNRLTKLNVAGEIIWQRIGNYSSDVNNFDELKGEFNKLLIDRQSNLYLTSTNHPKLIAQIQPQSGSVSKLHSLMNGSNKVFINGKGTILSAVYFPDQNKRGLSAFNPASGEEKTTVGNDELYGLLLYPFGVDNQLNCYVYQLADDTNLPAIVQISLEGQVIRREIIKDLLVRSDDNTVFTHYIHNNTLEISGYYPDGKVKKWSVQLPNNYSSNETSNYKLIKVDEENKFYIFTGDHPGYLGKLLIFSEEGTLEKEIYPPPNLLSLESSLQSSIYWQVDSEGRIYVPITDPLGFKVVRLKF
ncbi:hypothetical protein [Limnofasciculus baicalensis]|uniref:Uncharacterized protein n=1 Tax=Limnofasciculus baicalensis BBK-W-15 TaxID=2699891 RepID=A0AAE3KMP7_9CYAN|nr:hypothetical protein [Limnofasciculus baicalensis]MCP2729016.1 hypothetical protein [Limnofasciculus baicalensis BBK-W-15]